MKNISKAAHKAVHEGEQVYATIHRHWFDVASQFILIAFFTIILTIIAIFADYFLVNNGFENLRSINLFFTSLLLIFLWIIAFFIWVDYHLDVWVVTSGRIINIEQKGMFRREISELDYGHIQDATSEVSGIIQTALDYGNVTIQTAGTQGQFIFRHVAAPEKIKTLVMHLHRQAIARTMHPGSRPATQKSV